VTYFTAKDDDVSLDVEAPLPFYNTCQDPDTKHFADWCHSGIQAYADVLVIFFATLLLFISAPFTFGLLALWLI